MVAHHVRYSVARFHWIEAVHSRIALSRRSEGFPRTGYFVPACVGAGRWADFESCYPRVRLSVFLQKSMVSCKRGTLKTAHIL